jgi:hypothetical protein
MPSPARLRMVDVQAWQGSARWPIITNNSGLSVRGTIKRVPVRELLLLHEEAARNGWTGTGRLAWLVENAERVSDIYVTLQGPKRGYVRCYVMVTYADGPAGYFMIDMAQPRLNR